MAGKIVAYQRQAMTILRSVFAVLLGYLVFALSGFALFRISGHDPHSSDSLSFMIVSVVYGAFFAALAGFVAALIGGRFEIEHSLAVAALIAAVGAASLLMSASGSSVWTQIAALLVMAPTAMGGGFLRSRMIHRTE
ncbi:MAG TPA: hypothetical protein VH437_01770 [Terriglobales bacterium]|jgi:hypothetical protein